MYEEHWIYNSRYRIDSLVHSGPMSNVYLGYDTHLRKKVAVKELKLDEEDHIKSFRDEAEVLASLSHTQLPKVTDFFAENSHFYLVMDYVDSPNLEEIWIEKQEIPESFSFIQVNKWVNSLLHLLQWLHMRNLYHRDIKPANLKLHTEDKDQLILLDFGLVYHVSLPPESAIRAASAGFSPPEQYEADGIIGAGNDIYSTGATIYWLLTGVFPIGAIERKRSKIDPLLPVNKLNPKVSPSLSKVVQRAMALDYHHRYKSAKHLLVAWNTVSSSMLNTAQYPHPPSGNKNSLKFLLRAWSISAVFILIVMGTYFSFWSDKKPQASPASLGNMTEITVASAENGTIIPLSTIPIDIDRAQDVKELTHWGNGLANEMVVSEDGTLKGIASSIGVFLYQKTLDGLVTTYVPIDNATSITINGDMSRMAVGTQSGTVEVWSLTIPIVRQRLFEEHTGEIRSVTFALQDSVVASASRDGTIRLWSLIDDSSQPIHILREHSAAVTDLATNKAGDELFSVSDDGTARLWDSASGEQIATFIRDAPSLTTIAFNQADLSVAVGNNIGTVSLWDSEKRTPIRTVNISAQSPIDSLAFNEKGSLLAISSEARIRLFDLEIYQITGTLNGHTRAATSLAFESGQTLWSTSQTNGEVFQWSLSQQQKIGSIDGFNPSFNNLAWSPDQRIIAAAADDGTIRLLDSQTGQERHQLRGQQSGIASVAFNPSGDILASASADGTIWLWRVETGAHLAILPAGHTSWVRSVEFSPDGRYLASGSVDATVKIWRLKDKLLITTIPLDEPVWDVAFSPNGRLLASATSDGMRLWATDHWTPFLRLDNHTSWTRAVAFSHDGSLVATASRDETIELWNPMSGDFISTLRGSDASVESVVFAPTASLLASGGSDGILTLWNIETNQQAARLKEHSTGINGIAFNPSGTVIATSSADGTVRLWGAEK